MFSCSMWVALLSIAIYIFCKWYRRGYIKNFHKKNVFITGTDTGFGRKLALDLDKKGLTVYAGCYTDKGADNLRKDASNRMKILPLDVASRESIIKAKSMIESDLLPGEGLWALVNNAGIAKGGFFDFATIKDYQQVMDVNFYGPIQVVEVFLPLVKLARGRIVNITSLLGRCAVITGPYTSSKFALEAYSDGLRRSMWPFGVRVSIIEPGGFKTTITDQDFLNKDNEIHWEQLPPELKEVYDKDLCRKLAAVVQFYNNLPFLSTFNKLELVTDSITHAIGGKYPKDRYVVGLDAQLLTRLWIFLPDNLLDTVLMHIVFRQVVKYVRTKVQQVRAKTD